MGDILNILHARADKIDWRHLLNLVGEEASRRGAAAQIFGWLCPAEARRIPSFVWQKLGVNPPKDEFSCQADKRRVRLLDSRDWFGETKDANNELEFNRHKKSFEVKRDELRMRISDRQDSRAAGD